MPRWRVFVVVFCVVVCLFVLSPRHNDVDSASPFSSRVLTATPATVQKISRKSLETLNPRSDEDCHALPLHFNITSKMHYVTLCYSSDSCKGVLHISVKNCERSLRALSRNRTLSDYFQKRGPDVFRFRLDGPEVHAGMSRYDGKCVYSIRFPSLHLSGEYNLAVEWLYSEYAALDELRNVWPPLLKQPLLPEAPFSTNYHLQQCTLPSTVVIQCNRDSGHSHNLKLCTGYEKTAGRWKRNVSASVFTRVRVKKLRRDPILFQWALQKDFLYQWIPDYCRKPDVDIVSMQRLLAGKRIVVGGDSQLRALYYGIVNFLTGHGEDCLRNISQLAMEPSYCVANVKGSQRKKIHEIQVDFVDDLFLDKFYSSNRYHSYDVIVVGFAQHPASKEHWPVDKYRNSFIARKRKLDSLRRENKTVVWYLSPQYPHTRFGYPVVVRDWRTDPRLQLFNSLATAYLQNDIPVVDGFAISTAMSHTSPDQAHFSNFVSFEIVTQLMNILLRNLQRDLSDAL